MILALLSSSPAAASSLPRNAIAASSAFHDEFRAAYGSVLWTMMVLRWCDRRWDRPRETAKAEARLKALDARAVRRGLRRQMGQAARDNARRMAVMRLDIRCSGGFDRFPASANRALTKTERLLRDS